VALGFEAGDAIVDLDDLAEQKVKPSIELGVGTLQAALHGSASSDPISERY
jgi:hypothetical protein